MTCLTEEDSKALALRVERYGLDVVALQTQFLELRGFAVTFPAELLAHFSNFWQLVFLVPQRAPSLSVRLLGSALVPITPVSSVVALGVHAQRKALATVGSSSVALTVIRCHRSPL